MALNNALMTAGVMHARHSPTRHVFRYGVYYLCFSLGDIAQLSGRFLSREKWNLLSFYNRDHGACDGGDLAVWMRGILRQWKIPEADGEIVLLSLPRILGFVFNPVSFWFCLDRNGQLRAVLSEVRNTFGERHCYMSFHEDRRPILPQDWLHAEKVFHVSPFMDVDGAYQFRFAYGAKKVGVWVNHTRNGVLMLATSVVGQRLALTSRNILRCFFRYPLVTFKVIGLIHFEAVRLLLKGMRYRPKPTPPLTEISR